MLFWNYEVIRPENQQEINRSAARASRAREFVHSCVRVGQAVRFGVWNLEFVWDLEF